MNPSAREWNTEWVPMLRRARAIGGRKVRIARGAHGQVVSAEGGTEWAHPWTISPRWDGVNQVWTATVLPGFVNGRAPVVQTAAGKVALYDQPELSLPWLALGTDGLAAAGVPQFFQDRGVGLAARADETGATPVQPVNTAPGNRLLRKCDVVLHQPRYGLAAQVQIGDGLATGLATTTVTLTLTPIDPTDALRVYSISQWISAEGQPDPETGDYTEPNYDEMVIGTVYVLSQPGAPAYSAPDQTWQPYVRHGLFWNLAYAQPPFVPVATQVGNPLLVPLAGGAAQGIINEFTSLAEDALNEAQAFIEAQSMQGTFWTPTGGGADARFPQMPPPAAQGTTGLDKDGRLAAERAREQAALLAETLDPVFPYYAPGFSLGLLT